MNNLIQKMSQKYKRPLSMKAPLSLFFFLMEIGNTGEWRSELSNGNQNMPCTVQVLPWSLIDAVHK